MGSLIRCFCRHCCLRDDDDDNNEERERLDQHQHRLRPPMSSRIARHAYQIAPVGSLEEDGGDNDSGNSIVGGGGAGGGESGSNREHHNNIDSCCRPIRRTTPASAVTAPAEGGGGVASHQQQHDSNALSGLPEFFRRLRERWNLYDSVVETAGNDDDDDEEYEKDYHMRHLKMIRRQGSNSSHHHSLVGESPLRTAVSFDATKEGIVSINPDTIVLPGSELQKQMARHAMMMYQQQQQQQQAAAGAKSSSLDDDNDNNSKEHGIGGKEEEEECVICMEGFDPTNPRMPTLCGCGQNKTYFHLPCLYQWIEQDRNCPSCRQKLRWEEF